MKNPNKISILIATLNAGISIGNLLLSLQSQTCRDFSLIIADGGSVDDTEEIVRKFEFIDCKFIKQQDFGIYHALNLGLEFIDTDYYLVIGADDILSPNAIEDYYNVIDSFDVDFVAASFIQDGKVIVPRSNLGWLYGLSGISSSHAVGTLIKTNLHKEFGLYSNKLPIAADQLFIKSALARRATIHRCHFIAGTYSSGGLSGTDSIGLLTEFFRVQLITEKYQFLQFLLFTLRIWKFYFFKTLSLLFKKNV